MRCSPRVPNIALAMEASPNDRRSWQRERVVFAPESPHHATTWWRIRCPDGTTIYAKWPHVYVPRTGGRFICQKVAAKDVPVIANDLPLGADGC
jgi:hypothetical protein